MMSFRGSRLADLRLPLGDVWLIEGLTHVLSPFGIADIEKFCPSVGRDMVRRVMNRWRDEGRLERISRGRDAQWRHVNKKASEPH